MKSSFWSLFLPENHQKRINAFNNWLFPFSQLYNTYNKYIYIWSTKTSVHFCSFQFFLSFSSLTSKPYVNNSNILSIIFCYFINSRFWSVSLNTFLFVSIFRKRFAYFSFSWRLFASIVQNISSYRNLGHISRFHCKKTLVYQNGYITFWWLLVI